MDSLSRGLHTCMLNGNARISRDAMDGILCDGGKTLWSQYMPTNGFVGDVVDSAINGLNPDNPLHVLMMRKIIAVCLQSIRQAKRA